MKKEALFLNKLKISFTLSVLFFIISMIPFALANKEEVIDSYKMEPFLNLIIPFFASFTFLITLVLSKEYKKKGISFYVIFYLKWLLGTFISYILSELILLRISITNLPSLKEMIIFHKCSKEYVISIFSCIFNLTNIMIGIICTLPLLYVYRRIIIEKTIHTNKNNSF